MNSFRLKSTVILFSFFLLLVVMAGYLFINIQRDHEYDKQLKFYSANNQNLQNFRTTLAQSFSLIYEYSSEKDMKIKEKYIRLSHILDSQFESMLNKLIQSTSIRKIFLYEYQVYVKVKDMSDRLFDTQDTTEQKQIVEKIKNLESKMMFSIDKLSENEYQSTSEAFNQRTKNYERLLMYYIVIIVFFLVFGFGMLLIFFSRNVANPLRSFMKAVKYLEQGDFSQKVNIKANTEFEKMASAFNDMIDKLKVLTHSLKEKNDRLESIVNTPAVGVIIMDNDHKVIFQNKWALSRFTKDNKIGFLKEKDSDKFYFKKVMDATFETYIFEDEDILGNKYECFLNKIDDERLLLIFDISEKKRLEENLKHYIENIETIVADKTKALNDAYSELETKNKELMELDVLKTQFLQNISHELRTPLTSIIGYLDVVLNYHNIPLTQRSFLQIAQENSLSLLKIINDLLNLTEIDSGHTKLQLQSVNIQDMLEELTSQIKIQAEQKKLKLSLDIDKKVSPEMFEIKVDETKIRNVFNSLLSNAIKFTKKGKVEISLSANKTSVIVQVTDTGIGIKKEDIGIIFDKFRQVDNSISKAYDGAGLGLPIAKKLVELHHGEIKVESEEGKGSTFTVILKRSLK